MLFGPKHDIKEINLNIFRELPSLTSQYQNVPEFSSVSLFLLKLKLFNSELENYKRWFYSARINFLELLFLVAVLVGFWLASTNQNRVAIKRFSCSLTWFSGDFTALQWLFGNALLLVAPSKISLMSSHSWKSGALCSGLNNMLSDSKAYCP